MNVFSDLGSTLVAGCLMMAAAQIALSADLETLTNSEAAVTVKVTPMNISPEADSWDFEIVLNTHSVALDQDMRRVAVLIDAAGLPRQPQRWEGDPPGGHHREGVLRFQPPAAMPEILELRIRGIGGDSERMFRWRLTE